MPTYASNGWRIIVQMFFLLCLSGFAGSSIAAGAGVCKDAIQQYCSDSRSEGREAVMACLESHKDELSSECAEMVDTAASRGNKSSDKGKGGVCAESIKQYCSDARSGGREAVVACLDGHKSELPGECAEQVDKMMAQ
jgi:hypothetical protein